ncbi:hypothetical protein STRIP9103_01718, partial [Streptomyces ipomoeae 91-03]
MVGGQITTE